jgi:integrase
VIQAQCGKPIGARGSEIDLEARTWTFPAGRMKAGKEHIVRLSDRVIEILASVLRSGDLFLKALAPARRSAPWP